MNEAQSGMDLSSVLRENKALTRRVERMTKEMKNIVALHDRALKLRDFSEREKNLQYEYNSLLLENAPDMIFILDRELRFRLGTKTFMRFLGQESAGTLMDMPFEKFFGPVMPDSWIESTRKLFESAMNERKQTQYNEEVTVGSEGGERKIFTISVAPAIDSSDKIMGVICLMHDSTELVRMKEAAEAATKAKSSFLASMSHEIRTPMNAIKGFSDLMLKTGLTSRQQGYANNIVNATSALLMIIDDILDFSKIEANRYEIAKEDYDSAAELSELCVLMYPKIAEKGLYLAMDVAPTLPSVFKGDNLRIRQILINIVNNAVKFTHKGGITLTVREEPAPGGECLVTYSVTDTGQGIKESEFPKIFQAFEQTDFYKNRNIAGTGLGLAISRNLAELMGGDISVESEYGAGSKFTIRIPQGVTDATPLAAVNEPESTNVFLFHSNEYIAKIMVRDFEKLGVRHRWIMDKDDLLSAAQSEAPTHIIVEGDAELAWEIAGTCPGTRVGCVREVSEEGPEASDNVKILLKPFLIFSLAAFLNDMERGQEQDTDSDKLGVISFENARVLIVDDNDINLIVASEIIRTYNIDPETASSGAEAIEKVKGAPYDLVFMDHMMPGMDGVEATAAIRALDIPQPPVIALTANAMMGMEEMYKKNGFDGYITKPIDVEKLNAVLTKWLR